MTKPFRIVCAVGTRPEAIKMAPVIMALRDVPWATVRVLATAQHRRLLDQVLEFFGITTDVDLNLMRPEQSLADLTSRMMIAVDAALEAEKPDMVLAQGDTTTVMVTALACFYRRVPFGHVEAGLRTFDRSAPFPEEMNRVLTSQMAAAHYAPTERARDHLRREGVAADRILVTGNTVIDALLWAARHCGDFDAGIDDDRRILLVTAHRRENFGPPLEEICAALVELTSTERLAVLFPVHPNPNVTRIVERTLANRPHVRLLPPLEYPRFVAAMKAAHLVLTDSGGVQEEAPSLGKPVLVLRDTTERPEGIAAGNACLVGPHRDRIVERVRHLLADRDLYESMARARNPYGDGRASMRIVEHLHEAARRV